MPLLYNLFPDMPKMNSRIRVRSIIQTFDGNEEDILKHINSLRHLEFIQFIDGEAGYIKLTTSGNMANIPS